MSVVDELELERLRNEITQEQQIM